MRSRRTRAAAAVAALFALAGLVGGAVFLAASEDAAPPVTTTTTSTTSTTIDDEAAADAVARALMDDLDVALTREEASCITDVMETVVGLSRLEELAQSTSPLSALTPQDRDLLLRGVVDCLPPTKASALLGSPSTTAPPLQLPDEDL